MFAKVPRPGRVKTRLCPPLTAQQAAGLYAAMLADVLARTAEIALELDLAPVVAVHPWSRRMALTGVAPDPFRLVPQRGADLGARMGWAAREAAAAGAARILLRGSDSPTLDGEEVAAALRALDDVDLVLRPDLDGGYGLVGLRRPAAGLFDHAMSSDSVLADTLANAARMGLRAHVSEAGFDVDTASDLRRLAEARAAGGAAGCPRTLDFLDANRLWPAGSSTPV